LAGTGAGGGDAGPAAISAHDPVAINNNLRALADGTLHVTL
jgi:hypothetical protein